MAAKPVPQSQKQSSLTRALTEASASRPISARTLIGAQPELAALISKLHQPSNDVERTIEKTGGEFFQSRGQLEKLSNSIRESVKDTDNILKMFPDMWLADQILVSSIMSPKDMMENSMAFSAADSIFPSSVQTALTGLVTTAFEKDYKFKEELPRIVSNALFRKGAHIKVILPENVLDDLINNTRPESFAMESLSTLFKVNDGQTEISQLGFLGDTPEDNKRSKMSIESMMVDSPQIVYTKKHLTHEGKDIFKDWVEVVDNFNLLKMPAIQSVRVGQIAKEAIYTNYGSGSSVKSKFMSPQDFKQTVFKGSGKSPRNMVTVPDPSNATRKSISRPLTMDAPTECCIPVCRPGKPEQKVGAFFLIDIDGNFVTRNSMFSQVENLSSLINNKDGNNSLSSMLLTKAGQNLVKDKGDMTVDHISKFYSTIVQRNLVEKLRHGRYKTNMEVHLTQQVNEIMLARVLCDQYTRLLYIPGELFTYFAYEYDDSGVGRSYLDEVKMLTSIRGILMFAKVMGMVKNSINVSHVKVKLDPRDPDPDTQMEKSVDRLMRVRQQFFPFGINSMPDLADWVTRAGLEIGFEGHPDIPDVGFEFENRKSDHTVPDDNLDELLRDYTYMRFGITSEMIDGAKQPDFAQTVQSQSILFAKRVKILQQLTCDMGADYVKKVLRYDPIIRKDAIDILKNNLDSIKEKMTDEAKLQLAEDPQGFVDYFYELFIDNIKMTLPSPNDIKDKLDKELIQEKSDAYKAMVDFFINSEFAPTELLGEWATNIDMLKSAYHAYLMRKWASESNMLPEVFDIVNTDEDGNPVINLSEEYFKMFSSVSKSFVDFAKKFKPMKIATAIDLANLAKVEEAITAGAEEANGDIQATTQEGETTEIVQGMEASANPDSQVQTEEVEAPQ